MAQAIGAADGNTYDQVATALQVLRVPGFAEGLKGEQLYNYMHCDPPREVKQGSKKKA
jgi:hypothetical protein